MATPGWENFTESDVARHLERLKGTKPMLDAARRTPQGRLETALGSTNAEKPTPRPSKGHKYRAEPCIVTPDLTLFSKEDIRNAEIAKPHLHDVGRTVRCWCGAKPNVPHTIQPKGSLGKRAARVGLPGFWFGSLKEGRRWIELSQLQKAGAISGLERQPNFDLFVTSPSGQLVKIGFFHADFRYVSDGQTITEDTKATITATEAYRLRKRMVEAQYGISILET